MRRLNILVGCEESQIVTTAFSELGHNVFSCDLISCSADYSNIHIQADVLKVIAHSLKYKCSDGVKFIDDVGNWFLLPKFDLLIAFPPCDYLSFAYTGKERYSTDRLQKKIHAYQFFLDLWKADIPHICLENPMGYIHSGLLPCTQIIEPYYWGKEFGESYKKRTCLWLKNLPKLQYSKEDTLFYEKTSVKCTHLYINGSGKKSKLPELGKPFADKKERSRFHRGVAKAMATQFSNYILENY